MAERERANQQRVDIAENGRSGADGKAERHNHRGAEKRLLANLTKGLSDITKNSFHESRLSGVISATPAVRQEDSGRRDFACYE
jgi:hypothetical protein